MNRFPLFALWLRQLLIVGWVIVAGWLACEWLLPGSISVRLPLLMGGLVWIALTLILAPYLPSVQRRWLATSAFLLPLLACAGLAIAFSIRTNTTIVTIAIILLGGLLGLAGIAMGLQAGEEELV